VHHGILKRIAGQQKSFNYNAVAEEPVPIVIAIDEGREMLEYMPNKKFFFEFRLILAHSRGAGILAVLTSTSAHVANFLPSQI